MKSFGFEDHPASLVVQLASYFLYLATILSILTNFPGTLFESYILISEISYTTLFYRYKAKEIHLMVHVQRPIRIGVQGEISATGPILIAYF